MPDDEQETVHIDLASCKIEGDKYTCKVHKHKLIARGVGEVESDKEHVWVEAPPYVSQDIGISIPIVPGGPSFDISLGTDWPFTIFPITKKTVVALGDPWSIVWGEDRQ